jgi:hypothetical protein
MKKLPGLQSHQRYNEHMGCIQGCLDYLGIGISFPWLYGGTGNAFVLNMNDTVFVDCAQAWDTSMLFDLAPNLGFTVERFAVEHPVALEMPDDLFLQKQREAFDLVRARIDQGLPCYAWELTHILAYYVITGYDDNSDGVDAGYTYSGWDSGGTCPWDKLGTFDVKQIAVNCVHPAEPASDSRTVQDALNAVLERVERADGWDISARYRTGLAGYTMWAEALETGRANRDGEAYINQVWLECPEMAVEFLGEAKTRLPGRCDAAFNEAIEHYSFVRDRLRALAELHPERPDGWDWQTTFASPEGAALVREAAGAERKGMACLKQIARAL